MNRNKDYLLLDLKMIRRGREEIERDSYECFSLAKQEEKQDERFLRRSHGGSGC